MTYYVKLLGSKDMPMPDDWWWGGRDDLDDEVRFPKPLPKEITPGDELVYYAVGGFKSIFATARVKTVPELRPRHPNPLIAKKWPFASDAELDPSTKLRYVSSGPFLASVSPALQDKIGHGVSHFEIGRPEFDRAVRLLRQAKIQENQKPKKGP
jgi:hypothetical protein